MEWNAGFALTEQLGRTRALVRYRSASINVADAVDQAELVSAKSP